MNTGLAFIGGILIGMISLYLLVQRGTLVRLTSEDYILRVPFLGTVARLSVLPYPGIFTGEFLQLRDKLQELKRLLDPERAFAWADRYGVDYISLEGDCQDGGWSPGRLGFINMGPSHKRPYRLHLNPGLDKKALSVKLSLDTGTPVQEEDVYPFLFLHEIGHTTRAGNQNYLGLVLTHTISGQRHSLEARRELFEQKKQIEAFADRFALEALDKWHSGS